MVKQKEVRITKDMAVAAAEDVRSDMQFFGKEIKGYFLQGEFRKAGEAIERAIDAAYRLRSINQTLVDWDEEPKAENGDGNEH